MGRVVLLYCPIDNEGGDRQQTEQRRSESEPYSVYGLFPLPRQFRHLHEDIRSGETSVK